MWTMTGHYLRNIRMAQHCFHHCGCKFSCFINIITIVVVVVVITALENYCNTHPYLEHQLSSTNGKLALE